MLTAHHHFAEGSNLEATCGGAYYLWIATSAREGGFAMTGGVTEAFTSFGGRYNLIGSK